MKSRLKDDWVEDGILDMACQGTGHGIVELIQKVGDSPFQGNDGQLSSYFDYRMSVDLLRLTAMS